MNDKKKTNIIIAAIMLVTLAGLIAVYPKMPQTIPIHWNIHGEVDGTGHKSTIFALWAITAVCDIAMLFAEKFDPKGENYAKFSKVFNIFRIVFTLFMCAVVIINVVLTFDPKFINMNSFMLPCMGLMFAALGNYMPKIKHNYTFGIKCPWTLASENVWNKTHRMAGPLWVAGGIAIMLCAFLPGEAGFAVMMAVMFLLVIAPMVYSYFELKKEREEK